MRPAFDIEESDIFFAEFFATVIWYMNEKENFAPEFNALSREGQGAFVGSAFTPSELGAYLRHFNTKLYCQIWRTFARQLQDQIPLYHMPLARGPGIHIRTCLLFCFDLKKQFFSISFFMFRMTRLKRPKSITVRMFGLKVFCFCKGSLIFF